MSLEQLSLDDLRVESFPIAETDDRTLWAVRTMIGGVCPDTMGIQFSCNDTDTCMHTCGTTCPSSTCGCPP